MPIFKVRRKYMHSWMISSQHINRPSFTIWSIDDKLPTTKGHMLTRLLYCIVKFGHIKFSDLVMQSSTLIFCMLTSLSVTSSYMEGNFQKRIMYCLLSCCMSLSQFQT